MILTYCPAPGTVAAHELKPGQTFRRPGDPELLTLARSRYIGRGLELLTTDGRTFLTTPLTPWPAVPYGTRIDG